MRRQAISSLCERRRVSLHKHRQYSLLHAWSIWYSLLLLTYKPVQHVTVLNTVGNCNTMVSIVILCYNIIILRDQLKRNLYFNTLLFAYDQIIIQDTEHKLQKSVFILNQLSKDYSLKISTEKTKILTFKGKQLLRSKIEWSSGQHAGLWYPRSRVRSRPKPSDFSGEKIHSMPSLGGGK